MEYLREKKNVKEKRQEIAIKSISDVIVSSSKRTDNLNTATFLFLSFVAFRWNNNVNCLWMFFLPEYRNMLPYAHVK